MRRRKRAILLTLGLGVVVSSVVAAATVKTDGDSREYRWLPVRGWGFARPHTVYIVSCGPNGSSSTPGATVAKWGCVEVWTSID